MKRQLLAGTALVAAAMLVTGGAAAADKMMKPSISVNGYYDALLSATFEEERKMGGKDMAPDTPGPTSGRTPRSTSTAAPRSTTA